jgi:prepilin-type processing-associated H-X9-DG protein
LIELLVVIAIIAILASILFPVFARARENARRTACLSNSKQIALGIQMYIQDYDDFLPYSIIRTQATPAAYNTWEEALYPYTKSSQLFVCPSDATGGKVPSNGTYRVSYVTNITVLRTSSSIPNSAPYHIAKFDNPSQTIGLAETEFAPTGGPGGATNYQAYTACFATGTPMTAAQAMATNSVPYTRIAHERHLGTSNYVFIDGHAKAYRLEQTIVPTFLHGPC